VVVAALVAAGVWGLRQRPDERPATPAFQSMRMSTQTSRGDVFEAAISPDGRYLAYLAGTAGRNSLRVRQVATGSDVEVLPTRDAGLESPAFSPDGNYLYYLARKPENPQYRTVFEVPSLGGSPRERVFDVDSRVCFSPDGKRIAFWRHVTQEKQSRLVLFDRESSKEQQLAAVDDPESYQGGPSWSPDGKTIAVGLLRPAPDFKATVTFFDAASGNRRDFFTLPYSILNSVAWLPDGRGVVASGQDLRSSINQQVFLISYPDARLQRVTNDFYRYLGVSVSGGEEAIAAVRLTRLANIWLADATGSPARPLTSTANPEESLFGIAVGGTDTVLYDRPRDQEVQIWAQSASGGEPRALTSGTALSVNPRASGSVVLFDRLEPSGIHIWSMGLDGGNLRQLTSGGGEQAAAMSPDGRYAAFFPFDSPQSLSLLALPSGQVTAIGTNVTAHAGFSPDSSKLMLGHSEPDPQGLTQIVWKAVPVTGGAEVATFRLPAAAMEAAWTPDGQGMTFRDRSDLAWNVFRQDASGKPSAPVTRFGEGRTTGYQWSPDGTRLALIRRMDAGANVWVTGRDGSRPVQVTQLADSDVFAVRWLPDSRRLVVSAGKLSRDAVLIRSFR
jgi:Tol biopolymer transport system component